jgi:hypothetical protein
MVCQDSDLEQSTEQVRLKILSTIVLRRASGTCRSVAAQSRSVPHACMRVPRYRATWNQQCVQLSARHTRTASSSVSMVPVGGRPHPESRTQQSEGPELVPSGSGFGCNRDSRGGVACLLCSTHSGDGAAARLTPGGRAVALNQRGSRNLTSPLQTCVGKKILRTAQSVWSAPVSH